MNLPTFRTSPEAYDAAFVEAMARAYLDQTPWTRLRLSAVRDLVAPARGERILDLGCAAGAVTHFLSTFGCEAVGVDAAPLAIERARRLFPRLSFAVADVASLPFPDRSFDKAVAADLVEHLDDPTLACMLSETRRVLVPGGTLSLYTPNPAHPIERLKRRNLILAENPTHVGLRRAGTLEEALRQAGFDIEVSEWQPSFYPALRALERLGGRRSESLRYRLRLRAVSPGVGRGQAESPDAA